MTAKERPDDEKNAKGGASVLAIAGASARRFPRQRRIPLTPSLVIAGANALLGIEAKEETAGGQLAQTFLTLVRDPLDAPWHTAFVSHVGYWSHYDHTARYSSWPLPLTGDVNALARFAARHRILSTARPQPGEVFLRWGAERRAFVHAGIVVSFGGPARGEHGAEGIECTTLEGDTCEDDNRAEGVCRATRVFVPSRGDRFIRWVDLDGVSVPAEPLPKADVCRVRMQYAEAA